MLASVRVLAAPLAAAPIALPSPIDTRSAAGLSADEFAQIVAAIEEQSFDAPNDWDAELRFRRIRIGTGDGLVVRGTALLCGGTGNCQTWLMQRVNGRWTSLFSREAPVVNGMGFASQTRAALPDLIVAAHSSAAESVYAIYVFDGRFYRLDRCYQVAAADGRDDIGGAREVACR
jgi:hypothetical protein